MIEKHSLKILEYDKIIRQLADQALSEPGRNRCLTLKPLDDFAEIENKLQETDDFVKYLIYEAELPLSGFEEIRPMISKTENEIVLELRELNRFLRFLNIVDAVKKRLPQKNNGQNTEHLFFQQIRYLENLPNLAERLKQCIAGDDEIFDRATAELYSIRRGIQRTQENIKIQLNRIVSNKSSALQETIVTMRSGRYVVPVKSENRSEVPGVVHDTSGSGATVFIEPLAVVELNNKIRELEIAEENEIYRILQELSKRIADVSVYLNYNADILTELDFSQAKARLSIKMKATCPSLNQEGRIILHKARHPLIPEEEVVPIYFELGTNFNTLVVTGPNTGGKTVTLKTCGLFVLMTMSGLNIPVADHSEVSVFDQILADIGDEQSIEQNLSTFSSHLKQIIKILDQAGPSTLVLLDELGAGTDPSEGAALAIAILDFLRKADCHTVATTHYRELKGYALNTENVNNACCEFDEENLQPTYKLLIGVPGVSNAFKISQKLGLHQEVIQAAQHLMSDENVKFEELVSAIEKSHQQTKKMQDEIEILERESIRLKEDLELEKKEIDASKNKEILQAKEEAYNIVEKAKLQVNKLLENLREEIKEAQHSHGKQRAQKSAKDISRKLSETSKNLGEEIHHNKFEQAIDKPLTTKDIKIGEYYHSVLLNVTGQAVELPDNKNQVAIKSGVMTVNVPLASLRKVKSKEVKLKEKYGKEARQASHSTKKIVNDRKMMFNPEIKLLGLTVAEALSLLDEFIDDAVLSNLPMIRIVHGKGTGALRQAVHNTLKKDKRIQSFNLAEIGEGDSGVTIANL